MRHHRDYTTCTTTGKRGYWDRKTASAVRRGHVSRKHLGVFRCQHCNLWHLGHRPAKLTAGEITRDQLR